MKLGTLNRYLREAVADDLSQKMVMVGGPRQVGKTASALTFLGPGADESHGGYLNWDDLEHRRRILSGEFPAKQRMVVLDEIHKFAGWRNLLKGYYDTHRSSVSILVTGSARVDDYRKGGDSLQGRYHYYRMHPFSLFEVSPNGDPKALDQLLRYSGFPEPFFRSRERDWRRWQREHQDRVLRDDLRDLERVREVSKIELLLEH